MQTRGVTRHMARQDIEDDEQEHGHDDGPSMLEQHHRGTIWIPWTLILLGFWVLLAPLTLGYLNESLWAQPSGGRGAWFSDQTHDSLRAWLITWSDVVSGALLVVLGWRALKPDRPVSRWAACFVGIWLVFAPVVLWSPSAAAYASDSIVGLLVIALTILIPGMPNMVRFMQMGPPTPPGWSYNPSSWAQRSILIALGFAGLMVSRYLAAYQLGYIDHVWDPFFGFAGGTQEVLDSRMSHTWPISDAALGGVAYGFEFLMGFMGSKARWRTMPWMVTMFGILVIPLGLSHIALVMSQPVVVHHWSTLALLAAAIMLPMITLTVDEVVAMGQHVRDGIRRGDRDGSAWKVFWMGGQPGESTPDERTPSIADAHDEPGGVLRASLWGASTPWNLLAVAALGAWLLAAPAVFGVEITSGAADVAHVGGAFVVVDAVIAWGEPVRALRLLNVPAGLAVAGLVLVTDADVSYSAAVIATGLAVAALSVPRGEIRDRYGDWHLLTR
ncbi:MAG: vitamin K epoxide reductase family protein [Acidimicrobiia bacterium]